MATFALPLFARDDYEAFRRLMPNQLPATFEGWESLDAKEKADHIGRGHTTRSMTISSAEFADYLRKSGAPANLKNLELFLTAKMGW